MKKIFSFGLVLILCGSLTACGMSEEKIEQCREYEELLNVTTQNIDEAYTDIFERAITNDDMGYGEIKPVITIGEDTVTNHANDLNEVSMDDLKKYHEYLVDYRGTTQEEEDNNFIITKSKYMRNMLTLSYASEILSLYNSEELSKDDIEIVKKIDEVRNMPVNEYLSEGGELDKIRTSVYERAGIDYDEYVDLVIKASDIYDEQEDEEY